MYTFIISTMIFISLLLIIVVLLQSGKSEGTSNLFSSPGKNQLIGVSQAKNLLEQTTWGLFFILILFAVGASLLLRGGPSDFESVNIEIAKQRQSSNNYSNPENSDINKSKN